MQVRSTAAKVRSALETAKSVTPANAMLLAHAGVAVSALEEQMVKFTGTDGDTTVSAVVDCHVDEPGEALVLPRPLAAFLAAVSGASTVQLRLDGAFLVVERPGAKPYRFATLAASRVVPVVDGEAQPASSGELAALVAAVKSAAGRDGAVRVSSLDGAVALAATDSYRLSVASSPSVSFAGWEGVLPAGSLELLSRHEFSQARVSARALTVAGPGIEVRVSPLAVAFPGVDRVLDTSGCSKVTVPVAQWRQALRRLDAVSAGGHVHVQLRGDGDSVELAVAGAELGSGEEVVPVEGDASGLSVSLRVGYLADALASVRRDGFDLLWTDGSRPVHVVSSSHELDVHHVIMPVRV